jgi:hypothetical protein
MAKKLFMVLVALSLATAAFANGQNEKTPPQIFQGDKMVLKGTVSLQSFPHAILKVGDKQYVLMVPPALVDRSGVKDGAQVTVQGYQLNDSVHFGWQNADKNQIGFFVTQATIDGKDYDLMRLFAERMMGARGGGYGRSMMGGYGPGFGMMRGGPGRGGPGYGMMGPWDWDD